MFGGPQKSCVQIKMFWYNKAEQFYNIIYTFLFAGPPSAVSIQLCIDYIEQEGQDGPVSLTWLPDKFESIGLSVQEKTFNIDFQEMVAILDFQSEWF